MLQNSNPIEDSLLLRAIADSVPYFIEMLGDVNS